jgi:hypothetical protein
MRKAIFGCAIAAATLLVAACSSGGIPPTSPGGSAGYSMHLSGLEADSGNVIKNACFDTGKLAPWITVGKAPGQGVISKTEVYSSCKYSAFAGTTKPPAVDKIHGIMQKVKIPTNGVLTFWYYGDSDDEIKYADNEVDLMSGTKLIDQCFKKLITTKKWTKGTCNLSKYAGKTYDLVLGVNDNGYDKTYIYWYVDDVSLASS